MQEFNREQPHIWTEKDLDNLVKKHLTEGETLNVNELQDRLKPDHRLPNTVAIDMAIRRVCETIGDGKVKLREKPPENPSEE